MENNINEFVSKIELIDVFLKSVSSDCFIFPKALDPSNIDLEFSYEFNIEDASKSKVLLCFIGLHAKAISGEQKEEQFHIHAEYVLAYNYSKYNGICSPELFDQFIKRNALFNAYPFLRETLMNVSLKMSLPPVLAPLLKPNSIALKKEITEDKKKTKKKTTKKK